MKLRILCLALLIMGTSFAEAERRRTRAPRACAAQFNSERDEDDGEEGVNPVVAEITRGFNTLVRRIKRMPTIEELSFQVNIPPAELRAELGLSGNGDPVQYLFETAVADNSNLITALRTALVNRYAASFRENLRPPTEQELADYMGLPVSQFRTVFGETEAIGSIARMQNQRQFNMARTRLVNAYIRGSRERGRMINTEELAATLNITEDQAEALFGTGGLFADINELRLAAMRARPDSFRNVVDTNIFNQERLDRMMTAIRDRRRLVVTTAVAGSEVNPEFLASLLKYCDEKDADLLVFPANMITHGLDPILLNNPRIHILTNSVELNPLLKLDNIRITAKQINPLMGLPRTGLRGQTRIVGSPKMHVQTVPTQNTTVNSYPHLLVSTGAITEPNYNGSRYIQGRTDAIAQQDHMMGAVVLERANAELMSGGTAAGHYHVRHVEYIPERHGFTDMTEFFTGTTSNDTAPMAWVMGDAHVTATDPQLMEVARQQLLAMNPQMLVLHDLMDGYTVNHHERNQLITLAQKAERGELILEDELRLVVTFLNSLLQADRNLNLVIVRSNHDCWLNRWLNEGQFMREPRNQRLGNILAGKMMDGIDPLEWALNEFGLEYPRRVRFLTDGSSLNIGPANRRVELAFHGHTGTNGARGSVNSFEVATGRSVFGHTHTNARRNGTVNIGTSTNLVMSYNRAGFSNWVQSSAMVGENGEIQVFIFDGNQWYAQARGANTDSQGFFPQEYPRAIPNQEATPDRTGQVDQYGEN